MSTGPAPENLPQRIQAIREQVVRLREFADPDALRARVGELEAEMQAPGGDGDRVQVLEGAQEEVRGDEERVHGRGRL